MVAAFVRLKLTLMANTFRRSSWQTVGFVVFALHALGIVVLVTVGATAGGWLAPEMTGELLTVIGAVMVLIWWFIPIAFFGLDATLDPQRFATYAIPRRPLLAGLSAASIMTVPGAATVLATLGATLAWLRSPAALATALLGAPLAVALCIIGARAFTTALASAMQRRRSQEILGFVFLALMLGLSPIINIIAQRMDGVEWTAEQVRLALVDVSNVVGWTPLGAPWGMAEAAHSGQWLVVLGRFAIAAAALAALWKLWGRALTRSLELPRHAGTKRKRIKGLGFFDRVPATPTGAVAARASTYWLRDPRYSGSLLLVPALPIILLVAARTAEEDGVIAPILLTLAPLVASVFGLSIHNDIAMDHTAFALHVATGVSGRSDRWGRALPVLAMGVPVTILFAVLSTMASHRWDWLPPLLGLSLGILASSTGVSSALSTRWLYPVPRPGDSPFKQPQGAAGAQLAAASATMGLTVSVSLPAFILALVAFLASDPMAVIFGWITLVVGLAIGALVLLLGVRWGARTLEQRSPELLHRVTSYGA